MILIVTPVKKNKLPGMKSILYGVAQDEAIESVQVSKELVSNSMFLQFLFVERYQREFDKRSWLIYGCHHVIGRVDLLVFSSSWFFWWAEISDLYLLLIESFSVFFDKLGQGCPLLLNINGELMNSKQQFIIWNIDGRNNIIKWIGMIMLWMGRWILREK